MKIKKAKVRLVGEDSNVFAILGRVTAGLRKAGNSPAVIKEYNRRATAGDYNNLLSVSMEHVDEHDEVEDDD